VNTHTHTHKFSRMSSHQTLCSQDMKSTLNLSCHSVEECLLTGILHYIMSIVGLVFLHLLLVFIIFFIFVFVNNDAFCPCCASLDMHMSCEGSTNFPRSEYCLLYQLNTALFL
jgi:hypothetical protein